MGPELPARRRALPTPTTTTPSTRTPRHGGRRRRLEGEPAADADRRPAVRVPPVPDGGRPDQGRRVHRELRLPAAARGRRLLSLSTEIDAYANVARGGREPFFRSIYDPQDPWSRLSRPRSPRTCGTSRPGSPCAARRGACAPTPTLMAFRNEIVYGGALDDNGVPVYGNGARSRHNGMELEASLTPEPALRPRRHGEPLPQHLHRVLREHLGRHRRSVRRQPHRGLPRRHARSDGTHRARPRPTLGERPPRRRLLSRQHRQRPICENDAFTDLERRTPASLCPKRLRPVRFSIDASSSSG